MTDLSFWVATSPRLRAQFLLVLLLVAAILPGNASGQVRAPSPSPPKAPTSQASRPAPKLKKPKSTDPEPAQSAVAEEQEGQEGEEPPPSSKSLMEAEYQRRAADAGTGDLPPFGANLFLGNFVRTRVDGINENYIVMPGDRVAVQSWGSVEFNDVLTVDTQGNVFLPGVGPIRLAGERNADLTARVQSALSQTYRHFEVYTNLMTATPVAVYVTGGVQQPGRYAGIPSDSPLFFLDQAGGIDPNLGSYRQISVLRGGQTVAKLDLYDFILSGKLPTFQFQEGDTILVHQRGKIVELRGDVAAPCFLEFRAERMLGQEALQIIPQTARATEVTVTGIRGALPFNRTLPVADFAHFELRDGDSILVRVDGRAETILVRFEGEFQGPSVLSVVRGARLVDVLNHVPIDPKLADSRAVHLRRASVAKAQKDAIDDSLFRLERSALLALSQSNGESDIRVKEADLVLSFVERARLIQPLGRVVTARKGTQMNIVLEEEDVIIIPPRSNIVRVSGEVMMAQAVMYAPGQKAKHYIEAAGGYSHRADKRRVIVMRQSAEVNLDDPRTEIAPGDEILIPPKVDKKAFQNAVDVTQVLYQIAVSAAVIVALQPNN